MLIFLSFFQVSTHHLHSSSEDEDIESAFPNELSLQQVSRHRALRCSWEARFSGALPSSIPDGQSGSLDFTLGVFSSFVFFQYSYLGGLDSNRGEIWLRLCARPTYPMCLTFLWGTASFALFSWFCPREGLAGPAAVHQLRSVAVVPGQEGRAHHLRVVVLEPTEGFCFLCALQTSVKN